MKPARYEAEEKANGTRACTCGHGAAIGRDYT
jgi:hypothetical protein